MSEEEKKEVKVCNCKLCQISRTIEGFQHLLTDEQKAAIDYLWEDNEAMSTDIGMQHYHAEKGDPIWINKIKYIPAPKE